MRSERKQINAWCTCLIKIRKNASVIANWNEAVSTKLFGPASSWNFGQERITGDPARTEEMRLKLFDELEELEDHHERCRDFERKFFDHLKTFPLRKRGAVIFVMLGGFRLSDYCTRTGIGRTNAYNDFLSDEEAAGIPDFTGEFLNLQVEFEEIRGHHER